jgi:hypothetical protein
VKFPKFLKFVRSEVFEVLQTEVTEVFEVRRETGAVSLHTGHVVLEKTSERRLNVSVRLDKLAIKVRETQE